MLDSVFMDTYWDSKFPLVMARALTCLETMSDHAPILLTYGTPRPKRKCQFKIELG
jgi:hypothetical protein